MHQGLTPSGVEPDLSGGRPENTTWSGETSAASGRSENTIQPEETSSAANPAGGNAVMPTTVVETASLPAAEPPPSPGEPASHTTAGEPDIPTTAGDPTTPATAGEPDIPTTASPAPPAADIDTETAEPDGTASAPAETQTEPAPFHLPPSPEPDIVAATADPVTADGTAAPTESNAPPQPDTVAATDGTRLHPSAQNRQLPRTLAVANQKGGVGKTTTAVNLGAALAELDYRVLVVDLDPQGNATTGLGINGRNLDASIYDVILHDVPIEDVIEPTTLRNLFVVPATIDLAGAEIELVPVFSRELRLRKALEPVVGDFDFVLIDCPPSLGLLTVNGLAAATEVAVPIQCEYYALEGLGQLLRNVGLVQTNLNGDLEVSTIILTMYDARTKLAEQVADEVRQYFGDRVCRNVVPRTVRLSEAPSFGQPIIVFDPSSRGSIAYRELAKEVSGGAPKRTR